ncbi:MAG: extracellular solute-binding protein [Promicromonosporaceae bacterium]|nr:extracellular solute-binding protein [Promicromonosporaceae bacterium]
MRSTKTRGLGLVALTAALALVVAGCGSDDANGDEPDNDPTQAQTDTPPQEEDPDPDENGEGNENGYGEEEEEVAPDRADADLVIWADAVKAAALQEPAAAWGEANGITVAVQSVSGSLRDLFITADQAGNGPDVLLGAHDWIGALVQNSAIVPVLIPDTSDFSPTAIEAVTFNGQTFGVPYGVETLGLFVNNDLTDVPEPATIEEMVEAGRAGGAEHPLCLQLGLGGDAYHMQPLFTSGGGYIFGKNPDGSLNAADIGVDSDGGLAAAELIGALGTDGVLRTSIDWTNSIPLFAEGQCAYLISGPWAITPIIEGGIDYTISVIPGFAAGGQARSFATVNNFYVAANGINQAFAQQFVADILVSSDVVLGMFVSNQMPPAQISLMTQIEADFSDMAKFGELSAAADPMPAIPEMSAVWGPLGQSYAAVVDGADPAETFRAAAAAIREAIG